MSDFKDKLDTVADFFTRYLIGDKAVAMAQLKDMEPFVAPPTDAHRYNRLYGTLYGQLRDELAALLAVPGFEMDKPATDTANSVAQRAARATAPVAEPTGLRWSLAGRPDVWVLREGDLELGRIKLGPRGHGWYIVSTGRWGIMIDAGRAFSLGEASRRIAKYWNNETWRPDKKVA